MIETLAAGTEGVADDLSARELLASIRAEREAENAAAARQLDLAPVGGPAPAGVDPPGRDLRGAGV